MILSSLEKLLKGNSGGVDTRTEQTLSKIKVKIC